MGSTSPLISSSAVTDAVLEEIAEWQNRPLEPLYALVFFDAIRVKVRDEGVVRRSGVETESTGPRTPPPERKN